MIRTMKLFLPVLALALPFLLARCEEGKDIEQVSANVAVEAFRVAAESFESFPFTVTDEFRTVTGYEDDVNLSVDFEEGASQDLECLVLTEDNFYAWEQGLPCEKVWSHTLFETHNIVQSLQNGSFYLVFSNRACHDSARHVMSNCYLAYWKYK